MNVNQKLDDTTVVNILMDLGPSCTSNAATFRDALRLVTQKLPSGRLGSSSSNNGGGGAITLKLKEEEIARLIHFFAAVGARKEDDNSGRNRGRSRSRGRSSRTSSSSPHWNLDVVSQVLIPRTFFHQNQNMC